ncbi:alpha/beta fold hydrolase [Parapedobacter koreensis]|uniref:Homoserine O-acetyltransferase n=1 Tax=Parapedobacter koreensis TaxID=332977 RepID=A0A1H7G7C4_9SPHI|nr:alpha/beta fold hydrolase [Parapedobacter koreensis]SEK33964.1 homoserine O-acetyltransferase [Parapedobacter koreensis]
MKNTLIFFVLAMLLAAPRAGMAQERYPAPVEGDYEVMDFRFGTGETLARMNLHYTTIGTPTKGSDGKVNNAVLIMHGTTGSGRGFLTDRFAGNLFGPGQLLDATKYFIILTDAVGHGKSSKPSDGLHMKFPKYTYDDMVVAQYKLLTEHLGVDHLRLVMGTSMGGMHTWVWGYTYPDFMDALMPLASLPVEVAGRNRIQRKMAVDLIMMDPAWKGGEYTEQPRTGLSGAILALMYMVSSPLQWQLSAPTREQAEEMQGEMLNRYLSTLDANDVIYAYEASRFYNPEPHLAKIKAPLFAINSADDQVNPPELGLMERAIGKVKGGKYILIPISEETSGHGTHSNPLIWGKYLKTLLEKSKR